MLTNLIGCVFVTGYVGLLVVELRALAYARQQSRFAEAVWRAR